MAATTNSSDPVTMEFSNCSLTDIRAKLDEVTGDDSLNCLVEDDLLPLEVSVCGNKVLEQGEECDCGETELECDDPCCYPAIISLGEFDSLMSQSYILVIKISVMTSNSFSTSTLNKKEVFFIMIKSKPEGVNHSCDQCDYRATVKGSLIRHFYMK